MNKIKCGKCNNVMTNRWQDIKGPGKSFWIGKDDFKFNITFSISKRGEPDICRKCFINEVMENFDDKHDYGGLIKTEILREKQNIESMNKDEI